MNIKEFLHKHYLTSHLLAMALVVILLCLIAGFGLDLYTFHGESIPVPDIKGKSFEKAAEELDDLGLVIEVGDSGYNKQLPANTILAQTPGDSICVKRGHIVYVTVNSPSSPSFAIPDLVDNSSVREAQARLTAIGFQLTAPYPVDGEKDWVYGIICRGRQISNGDRVSTDHPLTLLVGRGTQDDMNELGVVADDSLSITGGVDDFQEVSAPPMTY